MKKELIPICKKIGNNYQNNKKKGMVGCHHLLLIYDAPNFSTVYLEKWPFLSLQNSSIPQSIYIVLYAMVHTYIYF